MQKQKVVFFDRDGVVNLEDSPYGYQKETFFFAPHFMELFLKLKSINALCFLVTNQSGINRGYFQKSDLDILHTYMQDCIRSNLTIPLRQIQNPPKQIAFDGIYFCPHTPDEHCKCRKPAAGMLLQACRDFALNLEACDSYIFGDKDTDMQAGLQAGVKNRIIIGAPCAHATHYINSLKEALLLFT